MASSTDNIRMGTCQISFGGVDLGFTTGGVEVTVTTTTHETKVDQLGDTIANEFVMGRTITVNCPLVETTVDNLVKIMPGSSLVTDNTVPASPKKKVVVKTGVGISLMDVAQELILHPIAKPTNDKSEDLVIPLANTPGGMNFAYKFDAERVFNCEFKGYADDTGVLFIYGDKAITQTP